MQQITSSLQQQLQQQSKDAADASQEDDQAKRKDSQQLQKNGSTSSTDFHGMWYPTVRRTLVCISGLSRCLDVSTY